MKAADKKIELKRYENLCIQLKQAYDSKEVSFDSLWVYVELCAIRYLLKQECTENYHLQLCHIEFQHDTLEVLRFFDMYNLQKNYVLADKSEFESMSQFWNSHK